MASNFLCSHCKKEIKKRYIEFKTKIYHESCFKKHIQYKCYLCHKPIEKEYISSKKGPTHRQCYEKENYPPCAVCQAPLIGQIIKDDWGLSSHLYHGKQKTRLCHSCGKISSDRTTQGTYLLSDHRVICGHCHKSSIETDYQARKVSKKIIKTLNENGLSDIPNFRLILSDQQSMRHKSGTPHQANIKGLTVSRSRKNEPTEHDIYILYALPQVEFEAVLAHEICHVWQNHHQIKLSHKFNEGLCNLMSALAYKQSKDPLAKYLREKLEKNLDPIYGQGYQRIKKLVQQKKWKNFLEELMTKKKMKDDFLSRLFN